MSMFICTPETRLQKEPRFITHKVGLISNLTKTGFYFTWCNFTLVALNNNLIYKAQVTKCLTKTINRSIISKSRIYTVIKITASELAAEVNGVFKKETSQLSMDNREREKKKERGCSSSLQMRKRKNSRWGEQRETGAKDQSPHLEKRWHSGHCFLTICTQTIYTCCNHTHTH